MISRLVVLLLLLGLVLFTGCAAREAEDGTATSASTAPAKQVRLVAFVGAASKPPTTEAKEAFEKANPNYTVDITFGGSGTLLSQMTLEETGDIYMPGSDDYMDKALEKQAVIPETRKIAAYLVPMICVQKGNPKNIQTLEDLTKAGIVVGQAEAGAVCLGDVAEEILNSAGLLGKIKKNILTYAKSCDQTQQLVQLAEVDAVIGWDAFKHWAPDEIDTVPIAAKHLRVRNIPAAVSVYSKQPEEAQKFVDFLASEEGKAIFIKHGYSVEPPALPEAK